MSLESELILTAPAPGLPDLLRRPLARPLQGDEGIARRPRFRRLDFDQVLKLEPAMPEHSEPVAVGQVELDARITWPLDPIHPERRPPQPVACGETVFLWHAQREEGRVHEEDEYSTRTQDAGR